MMILALFFFSHSCFSTSYVSWLFWISGSLTMTVWNCCKISEIITMTCQLFCALPMIPRMRPEGHGRWLLCDQIFQFIRTENGGYKGCWRTGTYAISRWVNVPTFLAHFFRICGYSNICNLLSCALTMKLPIRAFSSKLLETFTTRDNNHWCKYSL